MDVDPGQEVERQEVERKKDKGEEREGGEQEPSKGKRKWGEERGVPFDRRDGAGRRETERQPPQT